MTDVCKKQASREIVCESDSKSISTLGKKAVVPYIELIDKHNIRMYMGWCSVFSNHTARITSAFRNMITQYKTNPKLNKAYLICPRFSNNMK